MIDENTQLFARIFSNLTLDTQQKISPGPKRAIISSDIEKRWLKDGVIEKHPSINIGRNKRFAIISHGEETLAIAIDINIAKPWEEFKPTALNSGQWLALANEFNLNCNPAAGLSDTLNEEIYFPTEEAVTKYNFESISKFFPQILAFEPAKGSVFQSSEDRLFRCSAALVVLATNLTEIEFTQTSKEIALRIASTIDGFPLHLLIRSFSESTWEGAFLSIYRCIEYLFPMIKVQALRKRLGIEKSTADLAAILEEDLGWRRKEEEAIAELFNCVEEDKISALRTLLELTPEEKQNSIGRRIYKIRNDLVHYRPKLDKNLHQKLEWPTVFEQFLELVAYLYEKYKSESLAPL